jgi:hypothetical protein
LKNWVTSLNQKGLYDNKLPLGVFLEPEILLNTLRQKTCRQIKKPLDDLDMNVTFGDDALNDSIFSFKIVDMVLEGGRMRNGAIEASVNVAEREQVDLVTIGFVEKGKTNSSANTVELPLYLTSNKETMLLRMKVPCGSDKNEILLAGSSFFV